MNSPHHLSISSHNQHGRNGLSLQSCSTLANKLGPQKRSLSCNPPRFLHRIDAPSQNPTVSRFHLFASPIPNSENPLVCHRTHVVNGQLRKSRHLNFQRAAGWADRYESCKLSRSSYSNIKELEGNSLRGSGAPFVIILHPMVLKYALTACNSLQQPATACSRAHRRATQRCLVVLPPSLAAIRAAAVAAAVAGGAVVAAPWAQY